MSDQRYDASETVAVATSAAAVVARSPRVGYVPFRANRVRDGVAVALLVIALLLPWNLDFGLGVPGSDGGLFAVVIVVTLLAILAALAPHVGPLRLTAADQNVRRTSRIRLLLGVAYYRRRRRLRAVPVAGDRGVTAEPASCRPASARACC